MRTTIKKRTVAVLSLLTAETLFTGGCITRDGDPDGIVDYWLWGATQQPSYQVCADAFEEANPGLRVGTTQHGQDDYWGKLTAGPTTDQTPDVFTNHLTKYAQFISLEALVPLGNLKAARDVRGSDHVGGSAGLWERCDGERYGVPKDWDTIVYLHDRKVTDAVGVTRGQLMNMNRNPSGGDSFERTITHLSVDANGVRDDEPRFDGNGVVIYGFALEMAGSENLRQTQWGAYTDSTGWEPLDKNPWDTHFNLDDPSFQEIMTWYLGLVEKGYMPSYETSGKQSDSYQQMAQGKAALGMNNSWVISNLMSIPGTDLKVAPIPVSPTGHRSNPFNDLADSITRPTDDKEAAGKWTAHLGSSECQVKIADAEVILPTRLEAVGRSIQIRGASGLGVAVFTPYVKEGAIQNLVVTMNVTDVIALATPRFEAVLISRKSVSHLIRVNHQVNRLLSLASQ